MIHRQSKAQQGQRRRRAREAADAPPREGFDLPPHGWRVGHIEYSLHGHTVRVNLLATGHHCRSYGIEVDGVVVGVMGADKAWDAVVRPSVRPMTSRRAYAALQQGYSERDEVDAAAS